MTICEKPPLELLVSQFSRLPYPKTDCAGKTVIVTGANVGIGREAARHFVRLNAAKVIIGCRSIEKGDKAKASIESSTKRTGVVEVWQLDLGSFGSVKEFCRRVDTLDRLDIVVENAGIAINKFAQLEGYEETITVNVLSTFLMALMVLPALRRTATQWNTVPHLVIVSSDAHFYTSFPARKEPIVFEPFRGSVNMNSRYNDSKLLEVLIVREVAKEIDKTKKPMVILNTLNPGFCRSQLFRNMPWPISWIIAISSLLLARSCEMGSRTLVAAAVAGKETHGKFMSDCKVANESKFVRSEEGFKVGRKVYDELLYILDAVEPGIRGYI